MFIVILLIYKEKKERVYEEGVKIDCQKIEDEEKINRQQKDNWGNCCEIRSITH